MMVPSPGFFKAGAKPLMVFDGGNMTALPVLRVLLLILLFAPFLAGGAAAGYYSNAQARKAYETFEDGEKEMKAALQKKDERALRSAERTLLKARGQVGEDLSSLRYTITEPQLVPGGGRWPRFEDKEVTKTPRYYPNRLISQIRHQNPPRPDVLATITSESAGQRLTVKVTNRGQSDLESFKIRLGGVSFTGTEKEVTDLRAGASTEVQFFLPVSSSQLSSLRFEFDERYGFLPCPISF
jgi:hypothetical protein